MIKVTVSASVTAKLFPKSLYVQAVHVLWCIGLVLVLSSKNAPGHKT